MLSESASLTPAEPLVAQIALLELDSEDECMGEEKSKGEKQSFFLR